MDQDGRTDGHQHQGGPLSDDIRLIWWGFFPGCSPPLAKSGAGPVCSVSEAFTALTTSELEGTTALASMSTPACWVSTLLPVLPVPDILGCWHSNGAPVPHTCPQPEAQEIETAPLAAHLKVKAARGPTLALRKAASAVGTVLCPSSWLPATALNNRSLSSSTSPPVQSRLQLTPMTG